MSAYPEGCYRLPEPDANYWSETDLSRGLKNVHAKTMAFIEAAYREEFGLDAPDLITEPISDSLTDGLADGAARFFTKVNGGDL